MDSSRPAVNSAWPRGGWSNPHSPVCFNLHAELLDFQGCCLPLFFPCTGSGAGPTGFRASSRSHPLEAVLLTGRPPRWQPRAVRLSGRPGPWPRGAAGPPEPGSSSASRGRRSAAARPALRAARDEALPPGHPSPAGEPPPGSTEAAVGQPPGPAWGAPRGSLRPPSLLQPGKGRGRGRRPRGEGAPSLRPLGHLLEKASLRLDGFPGGSWVRQ